MIVRASSWHRSLLLYAATSFMVTQPLLAIDNTSGGRIQIYRTRIAQAKGVSGQSYDIFAETQNADYPSNPEMWRFDVTPMFIPSRVEPTPGLQPEKANPEIAFEDQTTYVKKTAIPGGYHYEVKSRLIVELEVRSDLQMKKALEALNEAYSVKKIIITENQLGTIPVTQVSVTMPDLEGNSPCKIVNPTTQLTGNELSVPLMFDCIDNPSNATGVRTNVETFKKQLHFALASITITYDAKEADRASVSLKAEDVRTSKFYNDLKGKGDSVYVTRADLHDLTVQASSQLAARFQGRQMSSDEMSKCVTPQMMSVPVSLDKSLVTDQTLARTYNSKDLDPTEVDKELSDTLDKGSTKDSIEGKTGGSVGLLGDFFKASGDLSGKKFSEWMSEHGVKVEWDGKKWVAKGLEVYQLNLTNLAEQISHSCVFETYGAGQGLTQQTRPLRF